MIRNVHAHPQSQDNTQRARSAAPSSFAAEQLATVLGMLADPTRLRATFALRSVEELCVGDLAIALDISLDQASYALKQLRSARLVKARKEGRVVNYALAEGFPHDLLDHCLGHLLTISGEEADSGE